MRRVGSDPVLVLVLCGGGLRMVGRRGGALSATGSHRMILVLARGLSVVAISGSLSGCLYQQVVYDEQRDLLRDRDGDGFIGLDDCDDNNPTVYPGAPEVCNGRDDDCDGVIDGPNARDARTFFRDLDGDGWGDANRRNTACEPPDDYVERSGDCDDFDGQVYPGAPERCDGKDTDCDGEVDSPDPIDATVWYYDGDNDRYGDDDTALLSCSRPDNYVTVAGDCNDADPLISPGATELCDAVDRNCDGDPTLGALDATVWYVDLDEDGYGDPTSSVSACEQPPGTVAVGGDCDDTDPNVNPGAVERCDPIGIDEDCNGLINEADPNAVDAFTVYIDADGDGWGDTLTAAQACSLPEDRVEMAGDCDDTNPDIYPGAPEIVGDGIDQSCDGNDACWQDLDNDGFGGALMVAGVGLSCDAPGLSVVSGDCNDAVTSIYPGALEVVGDGIDQSCDGVDACYRDDDGDGWGVDEVLPGVSLVCADGVGLASQSGDCDDNDPSVNPGAIYIPGDGIDQNCDGVDHCFQDLDGDGFGAGAPFPGPSLNCDDDPLLSSRGGDCAPADASRYPGAPEIVGDGIDQNCDGSDACYVDADGDGFGSDLIQPAAPGLTCLTTDGVSPVGGDCDDDDDTRYPGAVEIWYDGIDQNCSGTSDFDQDGDGFDARDYGGDDCDDLNGDVRPGQNLVLRVPESFETIAEAVARACDSDRVRVNDGVWSERLDLRGRGLTLEARVPGQTVIDAGLGGRALTMDRGTLNGLVVRRGRADDGACLRVEALGAVRVDNVRFDDCVATDRGGAVFASGDAQVALNGVTIRDAAAPVGAAVWSDGELVVQDLSGRSLAGQSAVHILRDGVLGNVGLLATAADAIYAGPSSSLVVDQLTAVGIGGVVLRSDSVGPVALSRFVARTADGVVDAPVGSATNIGRGLVFDVGATPFVGVTDPVGAGLVQVANPRLVRFSLGLTPALWDLHLLATSPARGADSTALNPDGSPADLGRFGGPLAPDFAWYDDLDLDGLPDGYERAYGLDPDVPSASDDPDGDGLNNLVELARGTLPLVADTDGDGFSDGVEVAAGTDPLDPASAP